MGLNIGWDRSADDGQGDNDVNEYSVRYSTSNDPPLSGDEITTITADGSTSYSYGYGAHANGTEAFVAIVSVDDAGNTSAALTGSINEVSSATGSDDFSTYTTGGGLPSAWGVQYGSASYDIVANAGVGGTGNALEQVVSPSGREAIYLVSISNEDDVEVLARLRAEDLGSDDIEGLSVALRLGGSAGSEDAYRLRFTTGGAGNHLYNIAKYDAGTFTSMENSAPLTADALQDQAWYYVRAQVIGTDLKLRVWEEGTSEPGTWAVTTTDSALASGRIGLTSFAAGTFYCDYFAWSTDPASESAPLP